MARLASFLRLLFFCIAVASGPAAAAPAVYRINAGGGPYTDSLGQVWQADFGFNTGALSTTTKAIQGTPDQTLFKTERYDVGASPELLYSLPVPNGPYTVNLYFAEIYDGAFAVGARVFDVLIEGALAFDNLDVFAQAGGGYKALTKTASVQVSDGVLHLQFLHGVENPKVSAIEVLAQASDPPGDGTLLHVVMAVPPYAVDYDGNGSESVFLKGSDSHTHEIGRSIAGFQWSAAGGPFATTANVTRAFPIGAYTLQLTIVDDSTPAKTLSGSAPLTVVPPQAVPGSLALYYEAGSGGPAALLDAVPATADFGEVVTSLKVDTNAGQIGRTPYTGGVLVRLGAQVDFVTAGTYVFTLTGGSGQRLFVSGAPVSGPVVLPAGRLPLEARFAVNSIAEVPLEVAVARQGLPPASVSPDRVTHDETTLAPVINTLLSSGGSTLGGESITITGLGFFPANQVVVHWGGIDLITPNLVVTPAAITFASPAGTGAASVTVQTPNGISDTALYAYSSGGQTPITFTSAAFASMAAPTQAEWGPDGRLYVGSIDGTIKAFTVNDAYQVTATQTIPTVQLLANPTILGVAFNPFDPPGPVRLYVAHSQLFANGGACFTGPSPYSGQVSVLTGPDFTTAQPVVTGLPTSNHDHGVNGLQFDNNGDLLIAVGGNTNAGVEACALGGLPESPLSAAIVKARLAQPGFNGQITYVQTSNGASNNDQVSGGVVDVAPGVHVNVFAPGLRNPWDLVLTTRGLLYATDNGPNGDYGRASTSATTQSAVDPEEADELVLLETGNYYGHPNRNRGRQDTRQNVFRGLTASAIAGLFSPGLTTFAPSTNGIAEYRAQTFGGAMRGNLVTQKWDGTTYRVTLSADGRAVTSNVALPVSLGSLDVVTGPGGALLGVDYSANAITVLRPTNAEGVGLAVYDLFPWRAPKDGGASFVIGGSGFGNLGNTTVTLGGLPAALTAVSATRLRGLIPARAAATADLLAVVVTVAGQTVVLPSAFRYLQPPGNEPTPPRWVAAPSLPASIGEVAAGIIGGKMYVVGESNNATFAYDLASGAWSTVAPRPNPGSHPAAEVLGGQLYLFGGFGGGAEGKTQIYNPATNSWSLGAPMPFAAGSSASAVINGQSYVAGGIVGSATVTTVARYNPTTNTWTALAPMPQGRNHTAAATDGAKLYVFGGRGPGSGDANEVENGFNTLQIYDPTTDSWVSSLTPGSTLAPLPQARGGMGKAVYSEGEFYVIGGETLSGAGATANGVYNRVDVYAPASNTWWLGPPMPTARHGIFPVLDAGRIHVAAGGVRSSFSNSAVHEIYVPDR